MNICDIYTYIYKQIYYWVESWRPKGACCHSGFCEKVADTAGMKNSQKRKNDY